MSTSKKVSAKWDHFTLEDLSVWLEEAYAAGIPSDAYVYTRARPMGKMREVWVEGNNLLSTDPKVKKESAPEEPEKVDKARTDNRPQETYEKWLTSQDGYTAGQPNSVRLQEGDTDRTNPREL